MDVERTTLEGFRTAFYDCLTGWPDTLFELCDTVLCLSGPVHSTPSLSLEPEFRRSHGSLYKALAKGHIDDDRIRRLLDNHRPADWPAVYAVDTTTWERRDAECSAQRGYYHSATKHLHGKPIVAGWNFQWINQLSWSADSWTAPLDVCRIPPGTNPATAAVHQVRRVVNTLGDIDEIPLFVFDAGYDAIALSYDLNDVRCEVLCRIRDDRVFYADAPPHPNRPARTGGRPPRHGARFKCSQPATWPEPTATLDTSDDHYGTINVTSWQRLHPRLSTRSPHWTSHDQPPIVAGHVIRVEIERLPTRVNRHHKTLWMWWSGPNEPDLNRCWRGYLRRFDIEHTFRFIKGTLGWTTPTICTPEQADRWTTLTIAAYTQLRLARDLVADDRLPWERRLEQPALTPTRVRRGFRRLHAHLGTPANPPKPSRAGPGRPHGTRTGRRQRHPVITKATHQV